MSFAVPIENRTPFIVESFVVPDSDGQELLLLIMVATFDVLDNGKLDLAIEQAPVNSADVYYGDPAASSTLYESDIAIAKPFVDVLVNGHAYAPNGHDVNRFPVQVGIGDISKTLMVTGERVWSMKMPSKPIPFKKLPIIYERAYGGTTDTGNVDIRNPIGVGYKGSVSLDLDIHTHVPNIEYPYNLINSKSDKPEPAGLGVVGRGWVPRIGFAGTYDDKWLNEQWPLLPLDFNPRHYQAAPVDQQSRTIRGGEAVRLVNLTPDGLWQFHLPVLNIPARAHYNDRQDQIPLRMDTIIIEPDMRRVRMTSRACIKTVRNQSQLREIVFGHVTSGWLRARTRGKLYIDISGRDGTPTREFNYKL